MTTTQDLINYYANLLIIQYSSKPKASAHVAAFVKEIIADQVALSVRDGFDLANTAVGVQLEILAGYRGAQRFLYGVNPTRSYFSMPAYADGDIGTVRGFAVYAGGSSGDTWFFLQYSDIGQPSYRLTDDELRRLTLFKAAVQSSDFGYGTLDSIIFKYFGSNVNLVDNGNMSITYQHSGSDLDTLFAIVNGSNSLPRPSGVALSVQIV